MPSEKGGTRSGAAKVKTKQGSNEKKNLNNMSFQQRRSRHPTPTLTEELTGATFSSIRTAKFKNIIKSLLGYSTLKYIHYTGQAVRTRQPIFFNRPAKPTDKDIDDNPYGAKYLWQAEYKEMMD